MRPTMSSSTSGAYLSGRTSTLSLISNSDRNEISSPVPVINGYKQAAPRGQIPYNAHKGFGGRSRRPFQRPIQEQGEEGDFKDFKTWFRDNRSNLPRYLAMIVFTIIGATQSGLCIQGYYKYPSGVNVIVEDIEKIKDFLPGLTVCDTNRIQMSKLWKVLDKKGKLTDFKQKLTQVDTSNKKWRQKWNDVVNDVVNEYFNDEETPIESFYGLAAELDSFVQYLKCDPDMWTDSEKYGDCASIPVIESLQFSGKCFTLFHNLSMIPVIGRRTVGISKRNIVKNPRIDLSSDVLKVKDITNRAQTESRKEEEGSLYESPPNEVIQMMVNLQPNETTDMYQAVRGKLYIHDSRHVPSLQEMFFDIEPGFYYEFYIRKVITEKLAKPYPTNCIDYWDNNYRHILSTGKFDWPLTEEELYESCIANRSMIKCYGQYPPEAPYFKNSSLGNGTKWGLWQRKVNPATYLYSSCRWASLIKCADQSQQACFKDTYEVISRKEIWPFTAITEMVKSPEEIKRAKNLGKCCAFVSIRYSTLLQNIRRYEPQYENTMDFICLVGGLFTLWVGLSIFEFYPLLEAIVNRFANVKF